MTHPHGLPGAIPGTVSLPDPWGNNLLERLSPSSNAEPTGLPTAVMSPHPVAAALAQEPTLPAPITPNATISFRDHPDYARLSARHADALGSRIIGWIKQIFRNDDIAGRVARAAVGAQRPVTTGRRIVVVGAGGGTGATTVAVALGHTLAGIRRAAVALVAAAGTDAMSWRLDVPQLAQSPDDACVGDYASQAALMTHSGHLAAIQPGWDAAALARGLGRFFAVTVIDAGQQPPSQLVAEAHCVVVVGSADAAGLIQVRSRMPSDDTSPRHIAALVPRDRSTTTTPYLAELRAASIPALQIPYDRHLAGGAALHLALMSERTQVGFGELASMAMMRSEV